MLSFTLFWSDTPVGRWTNTLPNYFGFLFPYNPPSTHTHTHRMSNVPEESDLREQTKEVIMRMKQEEATKHTENIVTGGGEEAEEDTHTNTPETTFLLVMQKQSTSVNF